MNEVAAPIEDELPPDGAKVFLSYSRKDRERAQSIADALRAREFGVFRDTEDILPTEEWRDRLQQLIEEADTIVFLMSPQSIASEVCAWEVEYATSLNKRIAPIVIEDVEGTQIPPLLARLNFIFCTERDPFENAVDTLASALNTDVDWVREHTRLAGLARRWDDAGRARRLLLRGQDIADAEAWRDSRPKDAPEITAAHLALIRESRRAAQARQRGWIFGSLAVAILTAGLAVFAYLQSLEADRQRAEAESQRALAETERDRAEAERQRAEEQRDLAEKRLRQALIERTRRNLADSSALMADGRHTEAAPLIRDALATTADLDDPALTGESAAAARRLLFTDRFFGYLEGRFDKSLDWPDLSIGPDGEYVAGMAGSRWTLWSAVTGHAVVGLDNVEAGGWRADGKAVIIRDLLDGKPGRTGFIVLDPESGQPVAQRRHDLAPNNAWIAPGADLALIAGSRGDAGTLLALNLTDGGVRFAIPAEGRPEHVAIAEDGGRIAVAFGSPDRIVQFDASGSEIARHDGEAASLRYAPDGHTLAFRGGQAWNLWPPEGAPHVIGNGGDPAESILFLKDGRFVARAALDDVALHDAGDAAAPLRLPVQHVFGIAGRTADGDAFVLRLDQQFTVHDSATGELRHRIGRVAPPMGGFDMTRDGRHLAIVHQDGLVTVWSTASGREVMAVRPPGGAQTIHLLDRPEGPLLAAVDGEGRLGLWRVEPVELAFHDGETALAAPQNGQMAVNGFYGEPLRLWNLAGGNVVRAFDGATVNDTDPKTGRRLLRMPGGRLSILAGAQADPTDLDIADDPNVWQTAWAAEAIAIHAPGRIDIYDTGTGKRRTSIDLGTAEDSPAVRAMRFLPGGRLAVLTEDSRLLVANAENGQTLLEQPLPEPGARLDPSADGGVLLIGHENGVWRFDVGSRTLEPVAPDRPYVRVRTAGPHAAVIGSGAAGDRDTWLMDLATGKRRATLDWASAYALGEADRIVVGEDSRGRVRILDARTGDELRAIAGDGGVSAFPSPPLLSADERFMLAVNGGADMIRLIDTGTGEIRAALPRRDGFDGQLAAAADFSAATLQIGIRPAAVDLSAALLPAGELGEALDMRFPPRPAKADAAEPAACDRLAAFVHDPEARTEGVAYADIGPAALEACGKAIREGDKSPTTLFQFARAATRLLPDNDVATAKMFAGLADDGYAAAAYSLAVQMIQGRAQGNRDTVVKRLRQAADGGAGIAFVTLSKLARAGFIDGDPATFLRQGVDAGLPAPMDELARQLAGSKPGERDFRDAMKLTRQAADAYAAQDQMAAAGDMLARAATYARRLRPGPAD